VKSGEKAVMRIRKKHSTIKVEAVRLWEKFIYDLKMMIKAKMRRKLVRGSTQITSKV
jgi:hypothetical protein